MVEIEFTVAATKALARIAKSEPKAAAALTDKIEAYATDPTGAHAWAKALVGTEGVRLRQGDYRAVVVWTDGTPQVLTVVRIGHRKDVYQ